METKEVQTKNEIEGVRYDPEMNKYNDVVLFPEKLARAKENIKNSNLIEFINRLEENEKSENK